ncbi:MAG TPA: branched-chain amino acid ABC transporter permease [Candidatus Jeotgalibaca merdavium]|jgi:branched-chain amino acid transport system permease protein|uniref:Branched-chain amino acid ABC transporter permease n=2 Tax=Jeotgalibaca TaxID=1470540 RepID=A0A6G7KAJ6_9LACT|nr:branched-chain amino acid ABC transporter permease [Jeotgalibaca arthritidis]QII82252.1 branched-chain amino acid ABC transporter permease [Jeotgalibaca arthritidis]HJA90766.1 branched-chain amino acid ABC transporter permease [Candidatus Jeotgalibaca merdavium]
MKQFNKYNLGWLILTVVAAVALYIGVSTRTISAFHQITLVSIMINIILAVGLNLVIGFSGQFSLGHAGFMAIGAYSGAIVGDKVDGIGGFLLGLVVGAVLAMLVALIVGIPTLRLKGDYLAIATLGVAEIIRIIIINIPDITNGARGITGIAFPFDSNTSFIMVAFIMVVLSTIVTVNYIKSSPGRATISIREDEIAAESMGVNTTLYKVIAFMIGAATASIAGSLYGTFFSVINPSDFTFQRSVDILIIVVFGGIGSVTGTFVAAVVLGILNTSLQSFGEMRMIIYALALIAIMVFRPGGLLGNKEFTISALLDRKKRQPKTDKEAGQ